MLTILAFTFGILRFQYVSWLRPPLYSVSLLLEINGYVHTTMCYICSCIRSPILHKANYFRLFRELNRLLFILMSFYLRFPMIFDIFKYENFMYHFTALKEKEIDLIN